MRRGAWWIGLASVAGLGAWGVASWSPAPAAADGAALTGQAPQVAAAPPALPAPVARPVTTPLAPPVQASQADPRSQPAEIGSEGFAPRIRQIVEGGSPQEAADAAWQLKQCRDIDGRLEGLHRFGATPQAAQRNDIYKRMVEDVQREQRRCQTVTPELDALRPALLLKALRGGVSGAALDLFYEMDGKTGLDAAVRQEMLAALRSDADRGNPHAMSQVALGGDGLTDVDRRAYKRAGQLLMATNEQHQSFLAGFGAQLAEKGLSLEHFEAFRKEGAAADINAKVDALLAANKVWEQRRPAPRPLR